MWVEETKYDEIIIHVNAGEPVPPTVADAVVINDTEGRTSDIVYTAITVNNPRVKIELDTSVLTWLQIPNSLKRLLSKITTCDGVTVEKVEVWKNVIN